MSERSNNPKYTTPEKQSQTAGNFTPLSREFFNKFVTQVTNETKAAIGLRLQQKYPTTTLEDIGEILGLDKNYRQYVNWYLDKYGKGGEKT